MDEGDNTVSYGLYIKKGQPCPTVRICIKEALATAETWNLKGCKLKVK